MINFGKTEIEQLTNEIWESMLNITLQPEQSEEQASTTCGYRTEDAATVESCVQITGAWKGAVQLDCSDLLARRATAVFLGLTPEEVSREQVRDAVGELANMSAGSIKPLLPGPCHISLPSVVDGKDYELTVRNGRPLLSARFTNQGEQFTVTILEADRRQNSVAPQIRAFETR